MKKILHILVVLTLCIGIDRISAYTEYKIGDVVPYNGMDFYVIKNSSSIEDSVTLLKAEPLTVDEANRYGVGHINRNTDNFKGEAYNNNGYGGMVYYSSEDCGKKQYGWNMDGCSTAYDGSDIKYVVDAWARDKIPNGLQEARLITIDDLLDNLGYKDTMSGNIDKNEDVPEWIYSSNYWYWTMSPYRNISSHLWNVSSTGEIREIGNTIGYSGVVRPVITLKKTVLGDKDESVIVDKDNETVDNKTDTKDNIDDNKSNESKTIVKVANTYMSSSIVIIILGFIIASISILIIYKLSNKKR